LKDEEIVVHILKGNTRLFSELVDRYQTKVYSTAYYYTHNQEDARDMAQEIFIKVYDNLSSFKHGSAFSTWLYRIAVNRCIDWTRKKKLQTIGALLNDEGDETDPLEKISDSGGSPEDIFLRQELAGQVQDVVGSLPEIYSTVLILYYFEDFSPQEIADIINVPRKTVETRLYRGKNMIRDKLHTTLYGGECYELQQI
jgi:RNA polymerase sigma-70 factor (ECF subfamily)